MQIGSCRTRVAFTTGRQFLEEVDRTIRLGAKPNQIKIYDDVDILLIDDLEEIFGNREAEQVFTNLFLSSMNEKKKQILCTSSVLAKRMWKQRDDSLFLTARAWFSCMRRMNSSNRVLWRRWHSSLH